MTTRLRGIGIPAVEVVGGISAISDLFDFDKNTPDIAEPAHFLDVLANDFGGSGPLSVVACAFQVGGTFTPSAGGLGVDFRAQTGVSGVNAASCLYSVTDGFEVTEGSISVELINNAPILSAISGQTGSENSLLQFTAVAVDPDNDPIIYSLANEPAGATIDPDTGVFSWTPTTAGDYTVDVIASDNDATPLSDQQTVNIAIVTVLVAAPFTVSTTKNITTLIDVIPYVSQGNPPYTLTDVSNPVGGMAVISDGFVLFTPTHNMEGAGSFDYEVTDALDDTASATCTVDIINTKAIWTPAPVQMTYLFDLFSFEVEATDTDPPLTLEMLSIVPDNPNLTFTDLGGGNGLLKGVFDTAGRYAITLRATDEGALTSDVVVTVDAVFKAWEEREINDSLWGERPMRTSP